MSTQISVNASVQNLTAARGLNTMDLVRDGFSQFLQFFSETIPSNGHQIGLSFQLQSRHSSGGQNLHSPSLAEKDDLFQPWKTSS